ncbi:hypothetical protein XENTR_v10000576 [Xenopus tropicalis]|nr:hypothetical protein XENTR_v10000576 [Xenopus tropicalis]
MLCGCFSKPDRPDANGDPCSRMGNGEEKISRSWLEILHSSTTMGRYLIMLLLLLILQHLGNCEGSHGLHTSSSSMQFTQYSYNATVYENSAAKTYVGHPTKMGIYLKDPSWDIKYKIISGDNENIFKAEEHNLGDFCFLRIRTKGGNTAILNREVKDNYLLTVKAVEKNSNAEARTRIRVQVLDTNDLRPLFSPTSYSVSLPENTAIRSSIAKVTATDADIGTNGEFYYSFKERTDMFAIHPTSGTIVLTGRLDYTETKHYEMEILAVDRGLKLYGSSGISSMARLNIYVEQANEHAPVISAVRLTHPELDKDLTYAIVTVDDNDQGPNGEIASLSIIAGDPLQLFKTTRTSPGSKEYKIVAVKETEWEMQPFGYNLTLQAKDKGSPPQFSATKVIHLTSSRFKYGAVKFEKDIYRTEISEFAPPNTPVVLVKAVPSNSHIKYAFRNSADKNRFSINPNTGLISTLSPVKAKILSHIELDIITSDKKAFTKVLIKVLGTNINTPEFTQTSYKAVVDENSPIGSSVFSVHAVDHDEGENGFITYSIANINPQPFAIDAFSGVITTLEDLDYELMPRIYTLKIRASDWGLPYRRETEIPVTITLNNLNDNIPLFEKVNCEGTVPKDLGVGEQITTVSAIDADELQLVKYRIESGDELDLFTLNPNSGVLSLKQPLSEGPANKVSFYSLRITATDGENLAQPIYINITVTSSRKGVHLNCEETGVAKMLAERLLQANKLFNRGTQEEVYFDSHMTNTHAPHFKSILPSIIAIKENVPVGANIIHMEANDLDAGFSGKLLYAISGGNDDSCFAVDMETGWLKILSPLDRELKDQYNLNITVYDLGIPQKSSWRLLDVNVLDVNDNPPEFLQESYSVHLKENEEGHNAIIQVQAVDKDLGVNGEVKYSILTDTDIFTINSETGVIKAVAPLDREKQHTHLLKIEARDQAENEPQLFSHVLLKVTVEDVNDNPPVFIPSNYHVKVREDLPVGTVITWLDAYDPDVGLSGQVRFSLLENGDGKFEVDKVSGAVRIIQELDFEEKQVYNLTARAKDRGKPVSLSSACYINVELIDVNENLHTPLFSEFVSKGSIREDVPIGTPVMTVSAHDEDTGRDGEIRYSIRDGSGVGVFTIHEEKGTIRTADNLDRETTSHYWLTVYATDRGVVPLSSFIQIYIEIEDVNDNAPQTVEPVYYPEVMENSAKDVSVVQINAFDPDSISSDKLTYKISTGNPQGFFAINPKTGLITTTSRKLDREQQSEHILEVTITDNGHPAKSAVTRVIVKVLDENDNKPQFLQKFYKIRLPEREKPERERNAKRDPIYRVVAVDKDDGANAEISYSIEEGDEHGKFFIEPKTGVVSSKKSSAAGEYDILSIKAVDNGRPQKSSTTRLHIEWIAKPAPSAEPITFEEPSFSFSVMESDPVAHMIGVITTEPLGSPLWFDITGGNYDSRFDVDKGTGTIIVARPLDAEQKSNYNLTVEATDGTRSVSTQVSIKVIDTNDHRPEFSTSKYEVLIPEDVQPDTEILQVIAIDRDEKNKLIYTLQSSTDPVSLKKFRMDPATGSLYTTEKLDHETMQQHILTVMVRDQDVPVLRNFARIVINVTDTNDHAPWFTSSFYEGRVYESAAVGSAVLQVSALDKDKGKNAEVGYSIESGNTANAFTIDPVLGIIKTAKELDRNNHGRYELVVKATDHGIPPLSQITSIHIFVTISNNAAPKFTKKEYSSEISETAHVGSFVAMLSAYSQSSVVYEIRDGNTLNSFDINPNSGVVTTQKQLDFETLPSFTLTVQATNMAGLSTNSTLTVHVRDENDNFPVFAQTNYRGLISESAPPNSVVLTDDNIPLVIRATDSDQESNALLVYQIVEPSVHKYFAIDSSTGALRTLLSLDYEQTNIFHFTVQVHDMGYPRLFAENAANVTIYVVDINDCAPVFSKDVYETSLLLPTYKGVRVITVNATDDDSGAYSQLIYSIIEGNIGDKFLIDPLKGTITVQNTTNLRSRYELTIRASDGRFSSLTSVKINVKESKESSLKFTQRSYSATVLENATKVKTLTIISPLGSRINEPLFFHILNPDPRFKISPTSGVLSTTGIPFDREEEDLFELVVEVSDEQKPPTVAHVLVQVTVEDVNDNNPVFVNLPYYAMVQIDAPEGHLIRHVTAVDRDIGKNGEITYYLKEHSQQFQIGPSGEIKLKKQFDPDSSNKEYFITVVAKDSGNPSYSSEVVVPITVMNKAMPVFENPFYSAEIAENANLHSPVVHVQANSPEGYRIIYSITDGDPFNQFNINFNTGVINVFAPLDFESHPAYKLRVRATDSLTGAHAEVFVDIILEDVNDNPPVFREKTYAATLSEASVIGTSVVQINAKDPDSGQNNAISFHLVETSGNISQYFHIDASSGLIETAKPLDYEYFQECTLVVRATDNGIPPLSNDISVHIGLTDLNDNPPAFIQQVYEVKISELSKPGHFVTCVKATDADSSDTEKLEYSILSGNDDMNFIINSKTGVITVSYLRKMILNPFYSINVSVSDGVFRSSAQVHVTVKSANLHSPKFGQNEYEVELSENSPVQTLVTELKAVDEDKGLYGQLTYHIINDFAKDNFNINERGQLFTAERFDREIPTNKVIPVSVMAKDTGGKVGFCIVNVILTDSNDNVPQFRATEYKVSIASDVPRGTPIVKVIASDSDEGANADIFYSIEAQSASVEENFGISQSSGTIITKESLIGLEDEVYSFFVKATDGGTPQKESLVPVFIRILPPEVVLPKFSEPFYTLSISEDTAVGTELDVVKAESNEPIIYSLMKGNTLESNLDDVFVIDKQNGRLKLEKQLDHESTKWYQFYVLAHNLHGEHEIISSVDVSILVKDVNDNAPEFSADPYTVTVYENTEPQTPLLRVQAIDADLGLNHKVQYSLVSSAEGQFSIDELSGIISLEKPLDRELQAVYTLTVKATDQGLPRKLSSVASVVVSVLDINDNPPVFEHREYGSSLTEDAPVGTEVLQVYATSRDIEVNAEITYKIISGNEHGKFTINPVTGMIFIIASLDYETSPEYYLTVEATDGGTPPLSDVASVNINVTDVNDNSPVFSQNTYTTVVGEDSVSGQSVLMVVADDADGPLNNHIRYSITEGNPGNTFIIDPVRGEVKVNKLLDRELISGYTLTIQAEDNGQPPRRNTTTVNIDVSDVNDNPPMFSKGNYSIVIQENKPVGFSILHLAVTDKDSSHNGPPFTFVFLSGNEDNTFQMDEQGLITTAGTLSRKIKDLFVLHIQVSDNGKPQLSSFTNIEVRVIEESIHPPAILPLEIYITTFGEEYSGGVIGKVHATDQDVYDTLTYSLDPKMENLFSVSKTGGKLIARKQLDVGQYLLNVSVSDGKFTTAADITVHIRQITQELLNHSITFRFANLSPEEFIGDYWRNFQRSLRNHLGGRKIDIQIISLQPSEPPRNLDVLLAAEKVGNTYFAPKVLIQKINASIAEIEDISGVKILDVFHKLCLDVECPLRFCDEKISVDESVMSTHSTARLSFVTPRHHRRAICLCKGGKCPTLDSLCDGNTCPEGTECVVDVKEGKFNCVCPSDRPGQCNVGSSVTFTGNSYIKYRLMENENKEEMKLSLKLRTYSAHAVVMYARGTDYSILEIQGGKLQYKFDCGSGPGIVSVQSIHVNDGQWHTVSLEVDGNYARLVLDRVHTASGTAPGTLRTLNLDNHVFFGGHMRQQGSKHGRNLQVTNGFRGCMDAVLLNGQELPLNSKSKNNVHIEESVDISSGCSLSAADVCSGSPCQNGGTCSPLSNGGYYCKCSSLFMGTHCDISINPCASNPCLYGGTCIVVKEDFMCHCRGDYTGPRCQFGPYCKDNPCKNSGKCIDSLDGPVCECESGFHGDKCLNDIDECLENPCPTGAMCENTYGSYSCNCSNGYGGKLCTDVLPNKYVSTSWNIGLAEVIGIIVFIAGTFSIVVIFVVCRTVANKKKKKRQSEPEDKHSGATSAFLPRQFLDPKVNKNIYSDIPPQVPVRPISYTPSIPSDSRNNLDRNSFEGSTIPEHPEFSTFNPDSVHGHRKAVAVCSVAPNLPPPPPSNSPSDSDSIQKPSWDYDYDAKVDLDPCLSKKSLDEKACHLYNPRESMSEIQSLSSFQSESCDDNGYHWDTSDWMPSVQLPDIQEYPHYEVVEEPAPHYTDPNVIDTDYYPGGYDIENDFPPPPDDFPLPDELPPLPPEYTEQYDSMQPSREMPVVGSLGSSTKSSPRYNLNKYLPRHQYPTSMSEPQSTTSGDGNSYREPYAASYMLGFNRDFEVPIVDNMSMSGYTSAASCTDVSAGCEMESEVMMSDYESGDDGHFEDVTIPPLDSQHHTEV